MTWGNKQGRRGGDGVGSGHGWVYLVDCDNLSANHSHVSNAEMDWRLGTS